MTLPTRQEPHLLSPCSCHSYDTPCPGNLFGLKKETKADDLCSSRTFLLSRINAYDTLTVGRHWFCLLGDKEHHRHLTAKRLMLSSRRPSINIEQRAESKERKLHSRSGRDSVRIYSPNWLPIMVVSGAGNSL